jgi:hypothetical protein
MWEIYQLGGGEMKRFAVLTAVVFLAGGVGMGWCALDADNPGSNNVQAQGGNGGKLTAQDKSQITGNLRGDSKHPSYTKHSQKGYSKTKYGNGNTKTNMKGATKFGTGKNTAVGNGFTKQPGAEAGPGAGPNALPAVHN